MATAPKAVEAMEQPACSASGWGSLPTDLLGLVFSKLSSLMHEGQPDGMVGLAEALPALASASPNRQWRSAALAKLRFQLRLATAAEVRQLAAAPVACTQLQLPEVIPYPAIHPTTGQWEAQAERTGAAQQLLGSAAFRQRSGGCLAVLRNCPLTAVPCLLGAAFPALERLSAYLGLGMGPLLDSPAAAQPAFPPTLRQLELIVPSLETGGHLAWPANLELCSIRAYGSLQHHMGILRLTPCACADCCGAEGFWGTCRALHLSAELGNVRLSLQNAGALRSCRAVKLDAFMVTIDEVAPPEAEEEGGPPLDFVPLSPDSCLQALAPAFAGTPLRLFQADAAMMSLKGPHAGMASTLLTLGLPFNQQASMHGLTAEMCYPVPDSRDPRLLRVQVSRSD